MSLYLCSLYENIGVTNMILLYIFFVGMNLLI